MSMLTASPPITPPTTPLFTCPRRLSRRFWWRAFHHWCLECIFPGVIIFSTADRGRDRERMGPMGEILNARGAGGEREICTKGEGGSCNWDSSNTERG